MPSIRIVSYCLQWVLDTANRENSVVMGISEGRRRGDEATGQKASDIIVSRSAYYIIRYVRKSLSICQLNGMRAENEVK